MTSLIYLTPTDPVSAVRQLTTETRARIEHAAGPLVVFIVAAAVLMAFGMTLAFGAAIYCMRQGGSMEWYANNGWKVWEVKVACRMP